MVLKETIDLSAQVLLVQVEFHHINCSLEGFVTALPDTTIAIVNNEDLHFVGNVSVLGLTNPFLIVVVNVKRIGKL